MYPGQVVSLVEAALGPAPPTSLFLAKIVEGKDGPAGDSSIDGALFGNTFAEGTPPKNSRQNQNYALKAALDFQRVCEKRGWWLKIWMNG